MTDDAIMQRLGPNCSLFIWGETRRIIPPSQHGPLHGRSLVLQSWIAGTFGHMPVAFARKIFVHAPC